MAKLAVALLVVVCSLSYQTLAASSVINTQLHSLLQRGGTANVFISLSGTQSVLNQLNAQRFHDRNTRLNSVATSLKSHAAVSQKSIVEFLRQSKVSFKSFWISNQIYIPKASLALVEKIAAMNLVSEITEEVVIPVAQPISSKVSEVRDLQWGVEIIEANRVWTMPGGNNGSGIVVGGVDTGVRVSHQDLRDNYLGDYGWFDPSNRTPLPNDNNGHGTHTMGTIAGANGIGVAPGSKWMACKGCATGSCSQSDLVGCGEFIACPTNANGGEADCTKAPHLVSNSWGGGQGQTFYNEVVAAWRAAGVVPFFSSGNNGPSCASLGYPGEHADVIGVGSTTNIDTLSSFSSVGPKSDGLTKPDIAAPGSNVLSSWHTSDDAYNTISGTSMACPHAAGAGALILSDSPGLTYEQVKSALAAGADTDVVKTGQNCGSISENFFPNNAFGHGRLNVYKSIIGRK